MSLSDEINNHFTDIPDFIYVEDVREAVRELRMRLREHNFTKLNKSQTLDAILKDLKEVFGEKLL